MATDPRPEGGHETWGSAHHEFEAVRIGDDWIIFGPVIRHRGVDYRPQVEGHIFHTKKSAESLAATINAAMRPEAKEPLGKEYLKTEAWSDGTKPDPPHILSPPRSSGVAQWEYVESHSVSFDVYDQVRAPCVVTVTIWSRDRA